MKKLISIFCVVAMLFSLVITANAADNTITLDLVSQDATSTVYAVNIKTTHSLQGIKLYFNMADAITAGATVATANGEATLAYVSNQKMVTVTYMPTDGFSAVTGSATLGTITLTNVASSFSIASAAKSTRTTAILNRYPVGEETSAVSVESDFNPGPYSVSAAVTPYVAAQPVPVKKAVGFDTLTTLEAADANYTNVAIWKATFEGLQTKGATNIGYDFTKTGSDVNNGKLVATEFGGDGQVSFVLAIHGVSAEEFAKLTFAPYYTVMEVPAN